VVGRGVGLGASVGAGVELAVGVLSATVAWGAAAAQAAISTAKTAKANILVFISLLLWGVLPRPEPSSLEAPARPRVGAFGWVKGHPRGRGLSPPVLRLPETVKESTRCHGSNINWGIDVPKLMKRTLSTVDYPSILDDILVTGRS
jgi:hypothetical protein